MFTLSNEAANAWDILVKAATAAVALIGGIIATRKFLHEKAQANLTAKLDSHRTFSSKRQLVYFELVEATATLGNAAPRSEVWNAASLKFWTLYWGAVPMVTDDAVAQRVDDFSVALDDPEDGVALRNASMDLARACRASLGEAWAIVLPNVERTTNEKGFRS